MTVITVPGIPVTQGSKSKGRNGQMYESTEATLRPWRDSIIWHTRQACREPLLGAVQVTILFAFPRPKHHYGTGRNANVLKPGAPVFHTASNHDLDKLARAVLDGLTQGGAYKDDGQVAALGCKKIYGARPGCRITIEPLGED